LSGVVRDRNEARRKMEVAISSGSAAGKLEQLIEAQGGDARVVDDPSRLPQASEVEIYTSPRAGVVAAVLPRPIGHGITMLGGGRTRMGDVIDHSVGFVISARPGDMVRAGEPLATVFACNSQGVRDGIHALEHAIAISDEAEPPLPLISHRVTEAGVEQYDLQW